MRPAKKHRITAAFLDIFIVGSVVQVISTLLTSLTSPDAAGLIALPLVVVYILAIIIYHSVFARRVRFCSPGERIAGCRTTPDGKAWFSVFVKSRWFLFLTVFFLLLLPANAFDAMQRANEYPLPKVIGRSIYVFLLLWTICRIAIGRFRWAIVAFIFLGLHLFGAVAYLNKTPELARIGLGMFSLQALFLTIALLVYRNRVEQIGNEQAHAEATSRPAPFQGTTSEASDA